MHDPEQGSGPSQTPAGLTQDSAGDKGRRTSSPYRQNSGRHHHENRNFSRYGRGAFDKRRNHNMRQQRPSRQDSGRSASGEWANDENVQPQASSPEIADVRSEQSQEFRRDKSQEFERRNNRPGRTDDRHTDSRSYRDKSQSFERRTPRTDMSRTDRNTDERFNRDNSQAGSKPDSRERLENRPQQRSQRTDNPSCMRPCAAELTHSNKEERNTQRFGSRHAPCMGGKRNTSDREPPKHSDGRPIRQAFDGQAHLYEVIQVRLARTQRLVEVNTCGIRLEPNTAVLIRVHRNILLATTVGYRYRRVAEINSLPFVIRIASDDDKNVDAQNALIEKRAHELASNYAIEQNLQMKVLSADLSHDHKNITINFASDVRVDFREMVAFLASQLKLRVEMYQLGLRNGTGLICGLGSCGQLLCCGRFLGQFDPIAVKQLRAQGLATNPKRISGVCGRLYCCMSYEYCDYMKERRALPKKGRRVFTRWGVGRITDIDTLREELVVTYENGESQRITPHDFVPVTDEIQAKVDAGDYEFPLEPAKFYLNADPSAACEVETQTRPRTTAKTPSTRVRRVETALNVRRRVPRGSASSEETREAEVIEQPVHSPREESRLKRRTLVKPRPISASEMPSDSSPLARMPRKVKAHQANLEDAALQKAESKNELTHPVRRRTMMPPNRGKRG